MLEIDPLTSFPGSIVIIAPHMDDETLACGGLISRLPHKDQVHIIYATDGMKSPAPVMPGDSNLPELGEIRINESTAAMQVLGIPAGNLHFLRLPEARLARNLSILRDSLRQLISQIRPDFIFIPFRFDRHPDHLAINHIIVEGQRQSKFQAQIIEYFVYHRWRLLPRKDIRAYIQEGCLGRVDITAVSTLKRKALDCYTSQTSIFYPWQTRPILTPTLLAEESRNPEFFLYYQPSMPGAAVFSKARLWIRAAHWIEPILKDWKYAAGVYIKRALKNHAPAAR